MLCHPIRYEVSSYNDTGINYNFIVFMCLTENFLKYELFFYSHQ